MIKKKVPLSIVLQCTEHHSHRSQFQTKPPSVGQRGKFVERIRCEFCKISLKQNNCVKINTTTTIRDSSPKNHPYVITNLVDLLSYFRFLEECFNAFIHTIKLNGVQNTTSSPTGFYCMDNTSNLHVGIHLRSGLYDRLVFPLNPTRTLFTLQCLSCY